MKNTTRIRKYKNKRIHRGTFDETANLSNIPTPKTPFTRPKPKVPRPIPNLRGELVSFAQIPLLRVEVRVPLPLEHQSENAAQPPPFTVPVRLPIGALQAQFLPFFGADLAHQRVEGVIHVGTESR